VAVLDEHLAADRFGAAVPDVVDDRPADVVEQRKTKPPARLVLNNRDRLRPPVQIGQLKVTQIRYPQAQPSGGQDHREITLAGSRLAVDPGQQPADLIDGP
jgi:hypothetical protein